METAGGIDTTDLFFEEVVSSFVDEPDFVNRQWLNDQIVAALEKPSSRYVLLRGETGVGKTGVAASLARQHPDWLRYFIRRDSWTPLSGSDSRSFLLSLGNQLATWRPSLFQPANLEIVVNQRIGVLSSTGQAVGIQIDDLQVSPFFQTALRVTQQVSEVRGQLTGIAVKATQVEPRLLDPDNLQYLALLDPAKVLLTEAPDARIVVLVDGLDEIAEERGLLDWLANSPELPSNVRFVLTSRPHASLHPLMSRRAKSLRHLQIETSNTQVRHDLTTYVSRVVGEASITEALTSGGVTVAEFIRQSVEKSDGNFAYLVAYCRALREAVKRKDIAACSHLLRFADIPSGLNDLYGFFLDLLKRDIEQLGVLEVQAPLSTTDRAVPAWEGVGQAILGVLAVAREPLTVEQIACFGGIRVWPRHLHNVVARLAQFLDQEAGGYRLFHTSFAEFLTTPTTRERRPSSAIDPSEWNERILRSYRRDAPRWAEVEWSSVDRYGLLHIADHLVALGLPAANEVVELVNPGVRRAMLSLFKTDSQFQRIIDQALKQTMTNSNLSESLPKVVGLSTVRTGIQEQGQQVTPAVLGLLAHLGKIDAALEYLGIMGPSMQRFQGLRQVRLHALPTDLNRVGALADLDRLVQYAVDIRPGRPFMPERRDAIRIVAVELAPQDLTQALRLADLCEEEDKTEVHDAVFAVAARHASLASVGEIIRKMSSNRATAYIEVAQQTRDTRGHTHERRHLLEQAEAEMRKDTTQAFPSLFARLTVTWAPLDQTYALASLNDLRAMVGLPANEVTPETLSDGGTMEASSFSQLRGELSELVAAAEVLRTYDPLIAKVLLEHVSRTPVDFSSHDVLLHAAELWAAWGEYSMCQQVVTRMLAFERELGGFGPAKEITRLATLLVPFDRVAAILLVDEAFHMIEAAFDPNETLKQDQINSALSGMVMSLLSWDTEHALKAARWITYTHWIEGSSEVYANNRPDALALIALSIADTHPTLAQDLLDECMNIVTSPTDQNGDERQVSVPAFFHVVAERRDRGEKVATDVVTSHSQTVLAITYFMNVLNVYRAERDSRVATTPADTVCWVLPPPRFFRSPYNWARTFRILAECVAARDTELAEQLIEMIADPAERAIGFGTLFTLLIARGDNKAVSFKELALQTLPMVPDYKCDIDLQSADPGLVTAYLNPHERTRFEVALRLALADPNSTFALLDQLNSASLVASVRADALFRVILTTAKTDAARGQAPTDGLSELHTKLLNQASRWGDPIHTALLLSALAYAVVGYYPEAVEGIVSQISIPVYRALAEIILTPLLKPNDNHEIAVRCQQAVRRLPVNIPPHQVATVMAKAAASLAEIDPEASEGLVREGLDAARQCEYPFYRGLAILEYMDLKVKGVETASLVAEIEVLIERLGNHYHAAELLCRLFPALVDLFPERVLVAITRIQTWGWPYTMVLLEHAAPFLVKRYGVGIASALHRALVDAFTCLSDPLTPAIRDVMVDGVSTDRRS